MSHLSSLVLVPHLSRTSLTYLVLNSKNARITELVIKKLWNNPVQPKNTKTLPTCYRVFDLTHSNVKIYLIMGLSRILFQIVVLLRLIASKNVGTYPFSNSFECLSFVIDNYDWVLLWLILNCPHLFMPSGAFNCKLRCKSSLAIRVIPSN